MALIDDFKARFPIFDTADVDLYFPALGSSYQCYYNAEYEAGNCDAEAILNLLAHLFTIEKSAQTGDSSTQKSVASQSVGNVSVSFNSGSSSFSDKSEFFNSSIYGQRFLMLTRKNQGAFFV